MQVIRIDPGEPFAVEETAKAGKYRMRRLAIFERWHHEKKISDRQLNAARIFNFDFYDAKLTDNYSMVDFEKVSRSTGGDHVAVKVMDARKRVADACGAVGQIGSSLLWDHVGLERSFREVGGDRRRLSGALEIALDVLANHYRV